MKISNNKTELTISFINFKSLIFSYFYCSLDLCQLNMQSMYMIRDKLDCVYARLKFQYTKFFILVNFTNYPNMK